jgi:hypothetical protein
MTLEILINVVIVVCLFVPGVLGLAHLGMYLEKRAKSAQAPAWVETLAAKHYAYLKWANSPYEKKGFWWSYPKWVDKL